MKESLSNIVKKESLNWKIDSSHSNISFSIRHLMIAKVKGIFTKYNAEIISINKDFRVVDIDLIIDADSINTNDENRDKHLRSDVFLDVANFKHIGFTSHGTGLLNSDGIQILWGDLTIKGITKRIALNVKFCGISIDTNGNEKAGFSVSGMIERSDWDITWNATLESGGFLVSDEITFDCEIELENIGFENKNTYAENIIIGN